MPTHLKPLFNHRLLNEALKPYGKQPNKEQLHIATKWANNAIYKSLLGQTEISLQGDFLTEFFDKFLGFSQVAENVDDHHMKPEHSLTVIKSGKKPDAALGFFGTNSAQIRAVLELKAPGADLDAKQGKSYGNLTPVEQAFAYASKLDGCRWVIVSNFTSIRLYRYGSGQSTCHMFDLAEIGNEDRLQELIFLLGRNTLLGNIDGESPVDDLANRTHIEEEKITKEFYTFYRDVRLRLFDQLVRDNPQSEDQNSEEHAITLLEQTQKILNRCQFGMCSYRKSGRV